MADIITIEECITRLDAIRHEIVSNSRDHFALSAGIAALYEMEKDAPAVNRWISVEDALPERNGCYLVWRPRFYIDGDRECGEATVCYFDGHDTWHDSYGVDFSRVLDKDDITHWMSMPEPPKE